MSDSDELVDKLLAHLEESGRTELPEDSFLIARAVSHVVDQAPLATSEAQTDGRLISETVTRVMQHLDAETHPEEERPQAPAWIGYAAAAFALVVIAGGSAAALLLTADREPRGDETPQQAAPQEAHEATPHEATPAPQQATPPQPAPQEEPVVEASVPEVAAPRVRRVRRAPEQATVEVPAQEPVPQPTADELLSIGNQARGRGRLDDAIAHYRDLQTRHGASRAAHVSRVSAGRLLLRRGNASEALRQFNTYLARGGALTQAALVGKATALEQLGRESEERDTWREIRRRFPDAPVAVRAARELAQ
ncbi:MAG: hypothetical protein AAGE52_07480 [Myxococcota bacterium]